MRVARTWALVLKVSCEPFSTATSSCPPSMRRPTAHIRNQQTQTKIAHCVKNLQTHSCKPKVARFPRNQAIRTQEEPLLLCNLIMSSHDTSNHTNLVWTTGSSFVAILETSFFGLAHGWQDTETCRIDWQGTLTFCGHATGTETASLSMDGKEVRWLPRRRKCGGQRRVFFWVKRKNQSAKCTNNHRH